jgi:hypothetical protein
VIEVSLILVIWISFVLLKISSKFLLHLECFLISPKRHIKISKQIKHTKIYIIITKKKDTSITVIYHAMSLTELHMYINQLHLQDFKLNIRMKYLILIVLKFVSLFKHFSISRKNTNNFSDYCCNI